MGNHILLRPTINCTTTHCTVGGFTEPVNKLAVFGPYLALFEIVAAIAVIAMAPWKKPDID
jgi:hypothetical protein